MSSKYKPKPMRKDEFEALKDVRDYILATEYNHWNEVGRPTDNHIYVLGKAMDDYINRCEESTQ